MTENGARRLDQVCTGPTSTYVQEGLYEMQSIVTQPLTLIGGPLVGLPVLGTDVSKRL